MPAKAERKEISAVWPSVNGEGLNQEMQDVCANVPWLCDSTDPVPTAARDSIGKNRPSFVQKRVSAGSIH